jgi:hypothetical protein
MKFNLEKLAAFLGCLCCWSLVNAQDVKFVKAKDGKKIDVLIGGRPFTSFIYPDSLEKPVLYPLRAANGTIVTRGYPVDPRPGEPTDHPHHLGLWFNFENVNGLDFWNNSFAIPKEKKHLYGWIKTRGTPVTRDGKMGSLQYEARWTDQQDQPLLEEKTTYSFSGTANRRVVDRVTTLTAVQDVLFKDAKDGMLGLRLAHELQIPTQEDQKFTDDKGNVTIVKGGTDHVPTGNYLTSEGKTGNDAWSTRGKWCKVFGKMGEDSVSITIIDHPLNINYPTFWHARGYGLFAANPLGENIFTNGKSSRNLNLKKGESVTFRFRIVIDNGRQTPGIAELNDLAEKFSQAK